MDLCPVATAFTEAAKAFASPEVLELGARRAGAESTLHKAWVPHAGRYVGADIQHGVDVDLVVDVHRLADTCGEGSFDILVSDAGLEHFKYPFLAAHQMMRTVRLGGLIYIRTHQSYPLHALPYDFFRFSQEGMRTLFSEAMGIEAQTQYEYPAKIIAEGFPEPHHQEPAYLCVTFFGRKVRETPAEFVYELQSDPVWPA